MELNIIVDVAQISATKPTTNFWTNQSFYLMQSISMAMIHYLKNKVGVVDFANARGVVMFESPRARGARGL